MGPILAIHITAGTLGIILGLVALSVSKGATLHRKAGMLFVYVMLPMAFLGIILAIVRNKGTAVNIPVGLMTMYLVITALTAVRPIVTGARWLHLGGMVLAFGLSITMFGFGLQAVAHGGKPIGIPAFPFFMFGIVAMLATVGDFRIIRSGSLQGGRRIARHLWRMSFALFIAAISLSSRFRVFPKPMRPVMMFVPLAILAAMFYWLWRLRSKRIAQRLIVRHA